MNTNQSETGSILGAVMLETLMNRRKLDDRLELDDSLLLAAMNGQAALSRSQYKALLNSPLSLRRMAFLQTGLTASAGTDSASVFWMDARFERRAADSGDQNATTHVSAGGHWQLVFEHMGKSGWLLTLTLIKTDDAPVELASGVLEIEVVDGKGQCWMKGVLDPDGEQGPSLELMWAEADSPEQRFADAGGFFEVRPC